jgi:hypothetical protein
MVSSWCESIVEWGRELSCLKSAIFGRLELRRIAALKLGSNYSRMPLRTTRSEYLNWTLVTPKARLYPMSNYSDQLSVRLQRCIYLAVSGIDSASILRFSG